MTQKIYLDMDGVLVDTVSAIAPALGLTPEDITCHDLRRYASSERINSVLDSIDFSVLSQSREAKLLIEMLRYAAPDAQIRILSEAQTVKRSVEKLTWLRGNFNDLASTAILLMGDCKKEVFAALDAMLIDDNPENTSAWRTKGGEAFLFPRRWNGKDEQFLVPLYHKIMEWKI